MTADTLQVDATGGDDVEFSVRGRDYIVKRDASITIPLRGQGPRLSGRPSLSDIGESVRDDGTLLSASVPTLTTSIPVITGSIPIIGELPEEALDS